MGERHRCTANHDETDRVKAAFTALFGHSMISGFHLRVVPRRWRELVVESACRTLRAMTKERPERGVPAQKLGFLKGIQDRIERKLGTLTSYIDSTSDVVEIAPSRRGGVRVLPAKPKNERPTEVGAVRDHDDAVAQCGLPATSPCLHNANMPNVLVRDLPDDVHKKLAKRASQAGLSLQKYLANELTRISRQPSLGELIERIQQREGGTVGLKQAVRDLDDARSRT